MTGMRHPDFGGLKPIDPLKLHYPLCCKWGHVLVNLNCKTRILWVMDGSIDMDPNNGFGLTEVKTIVEAATNTNYPVEITTAHRGTGTGCDVTNFRFDGTHTVGDQTRTIHQ